MPRGEVESKVYLSIQGDKIAELVPSDTEGAVPRVLGPKSPKAGTTVWERLDGYIEGIVTSIVTRDGNFGKQWEIGILDGEDTYILQMNYSSSHAKGFLFSIEGADLKKPIRFVPRVITTKENKKKYYLNLIQPPATESLKWNYTKENPNGLPEMVQVMVKSDLVWDDTDQMKFLHNMVNEKIIPNLLSSGQASLAYHQPTAKEHIADISKQTGSEGGKVTPPNGDKANLKAGAGSAHTPEEMDTMIATQENKASGAAGKKKEEAAVEQPDFSEDPNSDLPF